MSFTSQFDDAAAMAPSGTVRSMQNAGWEDGIQAAVADAHQYGSSMRNVRPGNPMRAQKAMYQQMARDESQAHILTQVLSGIRQSGSTARTARLSGRLGAVDCSALASPSAWAGSQSDVHTALGLVAIGHPKGVELVNATGVGPCFFSMLSGVAHTPADEASAQEILASLRNIGAMTTVDSGSATAFLAKLVAAFKLTPKRAVELYQCGVMMTETGGWATYGESWQNTACGGGTAWYENPWYLGAGAAALIGAVWFATRKKSKR